MKIRPVGAELFHSVRQTDRHDDANSRFLAILRTRPKKEYFYHAQSPTTLPPQVNGYTNLAANTETPSNAVHIRLVTSNVCSCEWLIKPALLFFCRYETVQRTGTTVDGDPASEYYVLMLGGGGFWFAVYIKNAVTTGNKNTNIFIFIYEDRWHLQRHVRSESTYRHLSFLLYKKRQAMYVQRNNASRNICTCSAILTAWYHYNEKEDFYGGLMSLATTKCT
jgi:hypothetical protein